MAITLDGTNGITSPDFEPSSSTTPTNGLFLPTTNALGFATNSTERLRLDASGNLGLGVTPSAWAAGSGVQFQDGVSFTRYGYTRNAYFDGSNYRYISSAVSSWYLQAAGAHSWWNAPSGTAGNAISFTQAMTLDASGNLGVGTTSPGNFAGTVKLVVGSAATTTTPGAITVYSGTATYGGLYFANGTVGNQLYRGAVEYNHSTDALLLYSAGSERARIDSSGNLLVGTTSTYNGAVFSVKSTVSGTQTIAIYNAGASATNYFMSFAAGSSYSEKGYITWNGSTVAIAQVSDKRLKQNIVDAPLAMPKIKAMKIRSFDFKEDGRHVDYGVIAQELNDVVPSAVFEGVDSADGSVDKCWAVGLEPIIPILVKAIQELTARLEALENK